MTSADDVLAQIDHAVDDWAVSDDAMRWLPDQVTRRGYEPDLGISDETAEWRAANPAMPHIVQYPSPRVYATSNAEAWRAHPMDLSQWTELGHTEDGAGLRFHFQPPPAPDLTGVTEAFARLRMTAQRVGIELTDWQARLLVALGPALDRPQPPEPDPLEDPDRPGLPLRIVTGRDAQQSPYGPKRRGRR